MLGLYPPSAFDAYKKEKTHFSASIDAAVEQIHAACHGIGTDDDALVKLLGPLSPNERGLISLRYKELHGKTLRELVKSETSGDFGYLLQLICFTLPQAEAYIIFHAMKGAGTSDHLLYSVLMGRTNEEMSLLKKTYFEMYDTDLSVAISDEISGDFLAVIMKALQVKFNALPQSRARNSLMCMCCHFRNQRLTTSRRSTPRKRRRRTPSFSTRQARASGVPTRMPSSRSFCQARPSTSATSTRRTKRSTSMT
ncbi:unnamed protein product [Phytophthora fragariaefolia]|uniref:Unnamed protein product n=1 Tax=Phytophthora fragariaefolia TaxID=1490495 RepID=A0A9W6Y111_9STRA|nr:unnamed protein product [Phytophthora fragariaefolia]